MSKKNLWLGLVVLVLSFSLMGCDEEMMGGGGYTFEFKVEHSNPWMSKHISKIEFINGSSKSDTVLATKTVDLGNGELSNVYKVSGFTKKYSDNYYIFGVNLTHDDGSTYFDWAAAKNKSKILVSRNILGISFSDGNW